MSKQSLLNRISSLYMQPKSPVENTIVEILEDVVREMPEQHPTSERDDEAHRLVMELYERSIKRPLLGQELYHAVKEYAEKHKDGGR